LDFWSSASNLATESIAMQKLTLLMILWAGMLNSVSAQKGSISGKLTDSTGRNPVPFATITVFEASDTSIITYRLSDPDGKFSVPMLPVQMPLRAVITASGLEVIRRDFQFHSDSLQQDWGILKMQPDLKELEEVLVVAERPPVVYRNDTIEFNANAFKTLPSALVEDLLKKFPGVDVDEAGNITVNGRRANRLTVDGREFFGSDPKMATRNLPANIIDRVQISDDQEQKDRDPNINQADLGVVINLKLKRAIKKGWFGKVYGGAGTNNRFEAGGIVNTFRDTLQISFLGYTNNLNRSAFSIDDVMRIGGFGRSNVNSISINSNGGFALNDIGFGGMGNGITRSTAFGVNANTLFGKKVQLSLQYFYGNNGTDEASRSNRDQFFGDTVQTTTSNNLSHSVVQSHRFSTYLNWKIDSLTRLTWRPSFEKSDSRMQSVYESANSSNIDNLLNDSRREQNSDQDALSLSQELVFTRNSARKKGRSFYASLVNSYENQTQDEYNESVNNFYKVPNTQAFNQYRDLTAGNSRHRLYARYNTPFSQKLSLSVTESAELFREKNRVATYDYDPVEQEYIDLNNDQSNGVTRKGIRSNTGATLIFKNKGWSFEPGLLLRKLYVTNEFDQQDDVKQDYLFVTPSLSIRKGPYSFSYSMNLTEPQATDLQPAVNNTNPLYQTFGNPDLKPGLGHTVYFNFFKYNPQKGQFLSAYVNGSVRNNAVVRARTIDENGVQTTRPVNIDGVWSLQFNGSARREHKFSSNLKLNYSTSFYVTFNRQFVLLNNEKSRVGIWSVGPTAVLGLNWKDKIELSQRYNPNWNRSSYEDATFPSLSVWRHTLQSNLIVRMPRKLVWDNSVNYVHNPQVAPGIRKSIWTWNASVSYLFMKEDRANVKLAVYDLLNQTTNVSRSVRENYIQDTETTILQRYFMLTFTYNIRNFGAPKAGQGNRIFIF
jgi:hypothetical protein